MYLSDAILTTVLLATPMAVHLLLNKLFQDLSSEVDQFMHLELIEFQGLEMVDQLVVLISQIFKLEIEHAHL